MNAELYAKLESAVRGMTAEEREKVFRFVKTLKEKNKKECIKNDRK